ncbi:MAG: TlpA disulfide reductase family protein [Proteobacteria bacterium]|nr:TlpA disulfide reductase family protein [Pseudomonadota bacterium]
MIGKRRKIAVTIAATGFVVLLGLLLPELVIRGGNDPPVIEGSIAQFTLVRPHRRGPLTPILDIEGSAFDLTRFRGKVVLLNIWATWCAPCVRELPSLDRLQAKLGGEKFEVLALSIDRQGLEVVPPFFERLGIKHLSVYLDPKSASNSAFNVRGLPTSYIVVDDGHIAGYIEGIAEWDSEQAIGLIRYYVERIGDQHAGQNQTRKHLSPGSMA